MSEEVQKLKVRALKKIAKSQISENEAKKIKKLIPTSKDSQSIFEAKKNSLLKKMSNMKIGGEMLKKVDKEKNPGLAKLPEKVRNKMGYAKKGKMAKAKKGKMMYANVGMAAKKVREKDMMKASMGMEAKSTRGYGAARTSGMGLQDEQLVPGKSLDYYKDLM